MEASECHNPHYNCSSFNATFHTLTSPTKTDFYIKADLGQNGTIDIVVKHNGDIYKGVFANKKLLYVKKRDVHLVKCFKPVPTDSEDGKTFRNYLNRSGKFFSQLKEKAPEYQDILPNNLFPQETS
jgi:hypothetical protein